MNRLTIGERITRQRIESEKRTARILFAWLTVALIILAWQYGR
jgi:hypothetical protein